MSDDESEDVFDLRDELQQALMDENFFNVAFAYNKVYPEAPNPALTLPDLGVVGLPLSAGDSNTIKTRGKEASPDANEGIDAAESERVAAEKSVCHAWEMDASSVSFTNPKWQTFVAKVVEQACKALGVDIAASKPRAKLSKLILQETGSRYLPDVDTKTVDGAFAAMVITLPSNFSGGTTRLSFGDSSAIHDDAPVLETSVLAWYPDVTRCVQPLASGCRLALVYSLVHAPEAPCPTVAAHAEAVERLTSALDRWRDDEDENLPEKLVYLLERTYSEDDISVHSLEGVDALRVRFLNVLAEKHGCRLGFATASLTVTGRADDYGMYRPRGGRRGWGGRYGGWGGDFDEHTDHDALEFDEITNRDLSIQTFVDYDGFPIARYPDIDEEHELIPADLVQVIEDGAHDSQEYDIGYLDRYYTRSALVIWPKRANFNVVYAGDSGFDRATADLYEAETEKERQDLVTWILEKRERGPCEAAGSVCTAALNYDNPKLWQNAIALCAEYEGAGVKLIDPDFWHDALEHWGWDVVRPSLEVMLKHDRGNQARLDFLAAIQGEPWSAALTDQDTLKAVHAAMQPWVAEQVKEVLRTLKPLKTVECPSLLKAAQENGGISCLTDVVLPQIISTASPELLLELATKLLAADPFPASPTKSAAVAALLRPGIERVTLFMPVPTAYRLYPHIGQANVPTTAVHTALAKQYMEMGFAIGDAAVVGAVLDKVADTSALDPRQAQECARQVMLPVIAACAEQIVLAPASVPRDKYDALKTRAMGLYFNWLAANRLLVTRPDIAPLFRTVGAEGDGVAFVQNIVPQLGAVAMAHTGFHAVLEELNALRPRLTFPQGYTGPTFDAVILSFLDALLSISSPRTVLQVTEVLDWLSTFGSSVFWQRALAKFVDPPGLTALYTKTILVPLAPALRTWGTTHGVLADLAPSFQSIVKAWLRFFVVPPPPSNATLSSQLSRLNQWSCTCGHCTDAKALLTQKGSGKASELRRIGAPSRKHVEGFLKLHAKGLATFETAPTVPQGLIITKSDALHQLLTWKTGQDDGKIFLKTIACDDAELRKLLGAEYANVMAALGRIPTHVPLPAASAATGTGAASTSRDGTSGHGSTMSSRASASEIQPPMKKRKLSPQA